MKKSLIAITIVLTMILALSLVPTIFAETDAPASIKINMIRTPAKEIDLYGKHDKVIDMFVGESIDIKTDIKVSRDIVIENEDSIKAKYYLDDSFEQSVTSLSKNSPNHYIKRETNKIKATKAGSYQLVVYYSLSDIPHFDSININVYDKEIKSMELKPNVTTVKTGWNVGFDLLINGSTTLFTDGNLEYYINNERIYNLDNYLVDVNAKVLDVKIVHTDAVSGKSQTFLSKIPVVKASALKTIEMAKDNYGFMAKNNQGEIPLYVTENSYPNISMISKLATISKIELKESDKKGYDKYIITIKFNPTTGDTASEDVLIVADDENMVFKLNIINNITSIGILPESNKFESNKQAKFHIVINGIKDVDTPVNWTIDGNEVSSHSNVLTHKSISSGKVNITAKVENMVANYSYEIDTTKNSAILTVVISLIVIVICIPILIAIKKSPKPNLKAMILKDNINTISQLEKLKSDMSDDNSKNNLKHILKILANITRSEKRAQQESFECENKAFGGALAKLGSAKEMMESLIGSYKTNSLETNTKMIDSIISELTASNSIIKIVEENM